MLMEKFQGIPFSVQQDRFFTKLSCPCMKMIEQIIQLFFTVLFPLIFSVSTVMILTDFAAFFLFYYYLYHLMINQEVSISDFHEDSISDRNMAKGNYRPHIIQNVNSIILNNMKVLQLWQCYQQCQTKGKVLLAVQICFHVLLVLIPFFINQISDNFI